MVSRRRYLGLVACGVTGTLAGAGTASAADPAPAAPTREAKLAAADGDGGDLFGQSVALDGSTALVGAPEDEDPNGESAGAAYVFERGVGEWRQAAKLVPDDGVSDDQFGSSLALSGSTALVAAEDREEGAGFNGGEVYAFERTDGTWSQQAKLTLDDGDPDDSFGFSLALDGSTALVGTGGDAAFVFERAGGAWIRQATLVPADRDGSFSGAAALDGSRAVLGDQFAADPNGESAGAAYVFERTDGTWRQAAKLAAADGDPGDSLGWAVALDGSTVLVGARFDEDPNGEDAGAAYAFERAGGGWVQQAKLVPDDGDEDDRFGNSVAVDGSIALVGAAGDEDPNGESAGAAYVFERADGAWRQRSKLAPDDGDGSDLFGSSAALDGSTALVGAWLDEDPNGPSAGAAYVFDVGPTGAGATADVCVASTEVRVGETAEACITLRGFENGFAGADLVVTFPEVVRPERVAVDSAFGLGAASIDGQDVRLRVSDGNDNFEDLLAEVRLGCVTLRGVAAGEGTVGVDPIQVDNDAGAAVELSAAAGCGTITCLPGAACPSVDGIDTTDPDGDGKCEDFNGNGRMDFADVNRFFDTVTDPAVTDNVDAFDFNGNGRIDFADVNTLFDEVR